VNRTGEEIEEKKEGKFERGRNESISDQNELPIQKFPSYLTIKTATTN
jgi:hypothetical protein